MILENYRGRGAARQSGGLIGRNVFCYRLGIGWSNRQPGQSRLLCMLWRDALLIAAEILSTYRGTGTTCLAFKRGFYHLFSLSRDGG